MDALLVFLGWTLAIVGGLSGVAGAVWLVVVAFATSVGWGLAVLLIPLAQLVFVLRHMDAAGRPFLVTTVGSLVFWAGIALVNSGHPPRAHHTWDPDAHRANLEAKAERDAAREAAAQDAAEAPSATDTVEPGTVVDDWEGEAWVGKNLAGGDPVDSDAAPSAASPPSFDDRPAETEPIDFENAWRFLDRIVRVTTRAGEQVEGPLLRVTDESLELESPSSGSPSRVLLRSEIEGIETVDDEPGRVAADP